MKVTAGETSKGNVENVIENWRKRNGYYIAVETLVELYPTVIQKEEFVNSVLEYLGEEISERYASSHYL